MTPRDVGEWIIARWRADDHPRMIVWQLAHTSAPLTRAEVMTIVRAYIDVESENRKLGRGKGERAC
jgi:hypothetical protein